MNSSNQNPKRHFPCRGNHKKRKDWEQEGFNKANLSTNLPNQKSGDLDKIISGFLQTIKGRNPHNEKQESKIVKTQQEIEKNKKTK